MSELEARFRISVTGSDELANFFKKGSEGAKRFGHEVKEALTETGRELKDKAAEIGRGLLAIGGLGAGLGIAEQANEILKLRDAIGGLGATANLPQAQLAELKEHIEDVSKATNQLGSDVVMALQAFKDKGGDIEEGAKNLELYGRVATATRLQMADVARAGADMAKLGVGQAAGFGIFARQRDLLGVAPRLIQAFELGGIKGEAGLSRGVALAQVMRGVLGDPEATRNALEASFQSVDMHAAELKESGINVYDKDTGEARNRVDVILDIIRKAHGRQDILSRVFGGRALKGINPLAAEFRETGGFASLEAFASQGGGEGVIDQMFNANRHTGLAEVKASRIAMEQASDRNFGGAAESFARHSNLIAGAYDAVTAHPLLAAGGLFGVMTAKNLLGGLAGGQGGGGIAGALTSAIPGARGVPVYVTNAGEMGGVGGPLGELAKEGGQASKELGALGLALKHSGTVLATFAAGLAAGHWLDEKLGLSDKIAGVSKGQIAHEENARAESLGGRASRELAQAQQLAKDYRSGKLTRAQATRALEGFSRSIDSGNISGMGLQLINELNAGDIGSILRRTDTDAQNQVNFYERQKRRGALSALPRGEGPLRNEPVGFGSVLADQEPLVTVPPGAGGVLADKGDEVVQAIKDIQPQFTIIVHGDDVTVSDDNSGTRAPKVQVRRSVSD